MLLTQKASHRGAARDHLRQRRRHRPGRPHDDEADPRGRRRAGRPPHPGVEGVGHRPRRGAHQPGPPGVRRAWATSRRPASPSTTATPASPRSTRAPTGSRPWTSSAASSRCEPAPRSPTTSARIEATVAALDAAGDDLASIRAGLAEALAALRTATDWLLEQRPGRPARRAGRGHAVPAPVQHGHRRLGDGASRPWPPPALLADATGDDKAFYEGKVLTARFFCEQLLPQAAGAGAGRHGHQPRPRGRRPVGPGARCGRGPGRRGSSCAATTRASRW